MDGTMNGVHIHTVKGECLDFFQHGEKKVSVKISARQDNVLALLVVMLVWLCHWPIVS